MSPCCDLDLELAHQSFHMTLKLMTMHYHSKFATKFSVVHKVFATQTFISILNLRCDLDLYTTIKFSHTTLTFIIMYQQTKLDHKMINSSGKKTQ